MKEIKSLMEKQDYFVGDIGHVINKNIFDNYVGFFSKFAKKLNKKIKLIFDTGNGMGITEVKALKRIYGEDIYHVFYDLL